MKEKFIPDIVISRLPLYIQTLNRLLREGKSVVSSNELGLLLDMTPSQIRRDLANFGGFGKQGTGYDIIKLMESLRDILNLNQIWKVALIGVGHVGQALINYDGFGRNGFEIVAAFEHNPGKIGKKVGNIVVRDIANMDEEMPEMEVEIAVITVPGESAQAICDRLVKIGIRSILNYAPVNLQVPEGVQVENIDPVLKMQKMTYYLQ